MNGFRACPHLSSHKFQSHPAVPTGRLIALILVGEHFLAHLEKLAGKAVDQSQVICVMTIVAAIQMIPLQEYDTDHDDIS